nr:hypothetical protein [Tanacetum cinerariifolium]
MLDWRILSRILLHLRDDITKIVIEILPPPFKHTLDIEDIYHLVLFVSRKGIQELSLDNMHLHQLVLLGFQISEVVQWRINIGTLKNLKKLSLSVCMLDNVNGSGVFQLTEFPPKLEDLTLEFCNCEFSAEAIVQNRASSVLCCLKSLKLRWAGGYDLVNDGPQSALNFDFASMRQLQLQSVNLPFIRDSENEVCLIKSLAAFSPVLQKMDLRSMSFRYGKISYKEMKRNMTHDTVRLYIVIFRG